MGSIDRWLANIPTLGLLAIAAFLFHFAPDAYQRSVQEDEILEWVTFWTFFAAACVHGWAALSSRRQTHRFPWFLSGLGLFCLLVALEEISWGQRLLGYRPPSYFLAENYQQEFNLHNSIADDFRQLGFLLVVAGYGVLLPFARFVPALSRFANTVGIVLPPVVFVPGCAATAILYEVYPWTHSGEWAEAMLGTSMLLIAAHQLVEFRWPDWERSRWRVVRSLATVWILTVLVGVGTARLQWFFLGADPDRIAVAEIEVAALRSDIAAARTRTRCGIHKRVFTMVEAYGHGHLFSGDFANLQGEKTPEERTQYFLDPWNSPYWLNHTCSEDRRRRAVFVYSFGPDRKRDSTDWEIAGDDIGAWISRPKASSD